VCNAVVKAVVDCARTVPPSAVAGG